MTKGELFAAMEHMPDETHLEIHVPACDCGEPQADFEIGAVGQVGGIDNPPWFTIEVGEFITNCILHRLLSVRQTPTPGTAAHGQG